ncbi:MAG: acyltransferase [Verrucomicrobia bacterium]|nr:acyltransferase [Verrucomicrobiota bacterium]
MQKRVDYIDGIRGLAILLVLAWHFIYCISSLRPGSFEAYLLKGLFYYSWLGVDIFFVLSGFLLTSILYKNKSSLHLLKTFWFRRALRILPLYWLILSAALLANLLKVSENGPGYKWLFENLQYLWSYIIFIQNITMTISNQMSSAWLNVTWSLAVEEQFYFILPILVLLLGKKNFVFISIIIFAITPILRAACILKMPNGEIASFMLLPLRWDSLFLGGIIALIEPSNKQIIKLLKYQKPILGICLCLFLVLGFNNQGIGSLGMGIFGHTAIAIMTGFLIYNCHTQPDCSAKKVLSKNPFVFFGTISYGIYLFHHPILGLCHEWALQAEPINNSLKSGLVTFLAFLVTIGISLLSYTYLEKPLLKNGSKIKY